MSLRVTQVDAFAAEPFRGNPAAVLVLPRAVEKGWMAAVAREMNLSETAFVTPRGDGWDLRWFTPAREVDLCGHATLAAAHVLWEERRAPAERTLSFATRSGTLRARHDGEWIELDFPAEMAEPVPAPPGLAAALGSAPRSVARNRLDFLAELGSEAEVRGLEPDFRSLAGLGARGVIVTAAAEPESGFDFVSRYFAPAYGIDEDPVTGSAHCALGPWWAARLGRDALIGYQASARGGIVRVRVAGARVALGGRAVTVMRGELLV